MPLNWEDVIREDDPYEVSDFRNAAYHLLTSQIIYESAHGQGITYRLIDRYRESFKEAFDLFGLSLKFDSDYRYIAAIPTANKQPPMRLADALILLVLRKAYHEQAIRGNLDMGHAVLSIEEMREIYRVETGRELPSEVGNLKEALAPMKSFGVVRIMQADSGSDQPFDITILPGITALVNEGTLARLADYTVSSTQAAKRDTADGQDMGDEQ
ncbi:MAG: DUF4194 domain-containing protein [Gallionella sp.]|nr:DUF4194 domain-containing protein [Gallionella sp.]